MADPPTQREKVLRLAEQKGVFTARSAHDVGVHPQTLTRLVRQDELERIDRGLYRLADSDVTENHGLVIAATAVPKGVICLISALAFHGIGTQIPHRIWLAIERRARKPHLEWPSLEIARFSGPALTEGVETHVLEGKEVKIYSVAKTLADIFKYRNKIGLDVAVEALRDAYEENRATISEIDHFARICRVGDVMKPYLQSLAT